MTAQRDRPAELDDGVDQPLESVQRFRDEFRHLKKRWDNRLILEQVSVAESWLNGRLIVLLYGNIHWGPKDRLWVVSVVPYIEVDQTSSSASDVHTLKTIYDNSWQDKIVLVDIIKPGYPPKLWVAGVRLNVIQDKVACAGDGLLYREEVGMGYKFFPLLLKGEGDQSARSGVVGSECPSGEVVQRASEIVNCISDCERERLGDWLFGKVGQLKFSRLRMDDRRVSFDYPELIEVPGEGIRQADEVVNVAIGPLNL